MASASSTSNGSPDGSARRIAICSSMITSSALPVGTDVRPSGVRDAMRQLPEERPLEVLLRPDEPGADLVHARRHAFAEECAHCNLQHEVAANRVHVQRARVAVERRDHAVDRVVGPFDDHRDPTVETPAAERRVHRPAPPLVIRPVGGDHRTLAEHELQHVELMVPAEGLVRQREHLADRRRVTHDRHADRAGAERAHRLVALGDLVQHGDRIAKDRANQSGLLSPRSSREGSGRRLRRHGPLRPPREIVPLIVV